MANPILMLLEKLLTMSDACRVQGKLIIPKRVAETRWLRIEEGVEVPVTDWDDGRSELDHVNVHLKYLPSCKTYVLQGGWDRIVAQKELNPQQKVWLGWDADNERIVIATSNPDSTWCQCWAEQDDGICICLRL